MSQLIVESQKKLAARRGKGIQLPKLPQMMNFSANVILQAEMARCPSSRPRAEAERADYCKDVVSPPPKLDET